jgi:hypothetical protein
LRRAGARRQPGRAHESYADFLNEQAAAQVLRNMQFDIDQAKINQETLEREQAAQRNDLEADMQRQRYEMEAERSGSELSRDLEASQRRHMDDDYPVAQTVSPQQAEEMRQNSRILDDVAAFLARNNLPAQK